MHNANTGQMDLSYQDIRKENLSRDLPQHIIWLCLAHIAVLVSADLTFSGLGADMESFQREWILAFERMNRFKAAHQRQFQGVEPSLGAI
jgi:hypothetical protein